jgi:hypothetical protein
MPVAYVCCSSYCVHEFELALHHNVTFLRKKRLVLLMMLNNPVDTVDVLGSYSMRLYVRHHTYIDGNSRDWADKLLYALPTRGMADDLNDLNEITSLLRD